MTENKKAPDRAGAGASTKVISSPNNAILSRVQAFYNGNGVIACGR